MIHDARDSQNYAIKGQGPQCGPNGSGGIVHRRTLIVIIQSKSAVTGDQRIA